MTNCTLGLKNKLVVALSFTVLLITEMNGQLSFDPPPSFFRTPRELPLVALATTRDVNVATYGAIKNDGLDDLAAIQAAITAARALASSTTPVRVVFDAGTYDIMPTTTGSHSIFVTTANNMLFEGNGSEIRNHNPKVGFFEVRSCTNVIFQNFFFDYAVLPFTQGVVTAVNPANNTFTLQIDPGFPLLTASHFATARESWGCLKDATGKLKAGADNLFPNVGWTQISGNTFRVNAANSYYTNQIKVNDYYVQIARENGMTVFNSVSCKNVTYLNNTIYSSPAGSFNGQENYEFNIINCKVIPRPGTGRVQSGNADIIHITGSFIGPWVQGCLFDASTDDAVNLKHMSRILLEVVNPTVVKVRFRMLTGDKVVVFNPRTGTLKAPPRTVTNVTNLGSNVFEITLDGVHNITAVGEHQTADKMYVTNRAVESFIFRNNTFKNGRRYGILIQASYGQIKNCRFENLSSSAIKMENGVDWSEGYIANNIEISDNTFINCGFDSSFVDDGDGATISTIVSKLKSPCNETYTWCGTEPVLFQGIENITITNNNFQFNRTGLNLQNINGGLVRNNTFTHNPTDVSLKPGQSARNILAFNNSNLVIDVLGLASFEEQQIKASVVGDVLTITNESNETDALTVALFDSTGRRLQTKTMVNKAIEFSISGYQKGMYIVTLQNAKFKTFKKIIL